MLPTKDQFRQALRASIARDSLSRFVEMTSGYELHPWQKILCKRLERLRHEKGQRLLIHKPPQTGGSQIVSKRLPLWLLLNDPSRREALACYNKTKAESFAWANKLVSDSAYFRQMFPDFSWARWSDDKGGYTPERLRKADAQPSIASFGLDSGFTGSGAEDLFIDDPYPNAQAARSEAYSNSVRSFWEETAEPRVIKDNSNVVVMFHRYHENDIAGYLMTRDDWEVITFPAIADGDPNDPTGREIGELLSPFHTLEALRRKEADDPKTFAGQFQGKPLTDGERLFEPWMFEDRYVEPHQAPNISTWFRGVDTAYETKAYSDHSATVRVAYDANGNLWLRGFGTRRVKPGELVAWIEALAEAEGRSVQWIVEKHNAGFAVADRLNRLGFLTIAQKIGAAQGSKLQRAFVLHDLAYARKVYIVKEGDWEEFMSQLWGFTGDPKLKEKDDLIDAATVVTTYLRENPSRLAKIKPLTPQAAEAQRFRNYE